MELGRYADFETNSLQRTVYERDANKNPKSEPDGPPKNKFPENKLLAWPKNQTNLASRKVPVASSA